MFLIFKIMNRNWKPELRTCTHLGPRSHLVRASSRFVRLIITFPFVTQISQWEVPFAFSKNHEPMWYTGNMANLSLTMTSNLHLVGCATSRANRSIEEIGTQCAALLPDPTTILGATIFGRYRDIVIRLKIGLKPVFCSENRTTIMDSQRWQNMLSIEKEQLKNASE